MMKMTNAMALATAIEVLALDAQYDEVVAKLQKMKEQAEKKSSAGKKPTATQTENIGLKEEILLFMQEGEQYTITDIMKGCSAVAELSNQRVSALVRQLLLDGKVSREEIKRKAYFSLVVE